MQFTTIAQQDFGIDYPLKETLPLQREVKNSARTTDRGVKKSDLLFVDAAAILNAKRNQRRFFADDFGIHLSVENVEIHSRTWIGTNQDLC